MSYINQCEKCGDTIKTIMKRRTVCYICRKGKPDGPTLENNISQFFLTRGTPLRSSGKVYYGCVS